MPETHGFDYQQIVVNPFSMHLSDAILATHLVKHAKSNSAVQSMHCRTAIAHSVFALECAANCFVNSVPRNHAFREKAELWNVFDKIDLYLLTITGSPKLPRDSDDIKAVTELIKIRDKHVHPRTTKHALLDPENPESAFKIKLPGNSASEIKPVAFLWDFDDSVIALTVVLNFLRLVVKIAGLNPPSVRLLLLSHAICADGKRGLDIGHFEKLIQLATTIDVDVAFLLEK